MKVLPVLKHCAQFDEDSNVRFLAINELGRNWNSQPDVFNILRNCAIHDPFNPQNEERNEVENPRLRAIAAIIKQYPYDAATTNLLKDRLENDSDEKVRKFAMRVIAGFSQ
ncbi:MAG: HEAT repeat domain-containing protein [Calothrix sp. SM1_7_51]|nr:HEAT repeat domain-containing protein [Calothrix sp. SM1_7_51]